MIRAYPNAVAHALSQLRLAGVNGPYSVLLSADAYTGLSETSDHGYPIMEHIKRQVDGEVIWSPAITGAFVLTTRGGQEGVDLETLAGFTPSELTTEQRRDSRSDGRTTVRQLLSQPGPPGQDIVE